MKTKVRRRQTSRLTRLSLLLGLFAIYIGSFFWESPVGVATGAVVWLLLAGYFALDVRESRLKTLAAVNVPVALFVAFARASCACVDIERPVWLTGLAVATLALLLVGIAFAVVVVSREQDERERRIILTSIAFAFLAVMLALVSFVLLDEYMKVEPPSHSWVLVTGACTWFVSYLILRERM